MQIRKGLNTDFARLECCDFSFTISHIAREPFIHCDLHIEAVAEPWIKTYELDIQTLENHCVNPDAGAAQKLMAAAHVWARSVNAPGLRLETQNVNVSACLFYRHYGFTLGGYDRYLYNALPEKDEVALFWYYMLV